MRLPNIAIKNYRFVIIMVFLAVIVGVYAFITMPRSEDPSLNLPIYTIVAAYPGTSPEDIEDLIVDPIEERVSELDDIEEIETQIQEGIATILVEMSYGVDADEKYDELRSEIDGLRNSSLPDNLARLLVTQYKPRKNINILQLAFVSESASYFELKDWAEKLEKKLDATSGVLDAEIAAAPQEEIHVLLDFQKMANKKIQLNQVTRILQSLNQRIPGGNIQAGDKSLSIKTSGSYDHIEEISNTIIRTSNGSTIYLKDIARVKMGYEDRKWIARHNQDRCIFLNITQKDGTNILNLSDRIFTEIDAFSTSLPKEIHLAVAHNQTPAVKNRIDGFFINLLEGMLLVGFVIFVFLGFRPSLVISILIPLASIIAIGFLDISGFALQQVSIGALIISLGILVDNGIVVVENTARFQQEGFPPLKAAADGTSEVGLAIMSATVTSCLSFLPLAFMGNDSGDYVKSLPITVIYTLVASLILSLTFIPFMAGKLIKPKNAKPFFIGKIFTRLADSHYEGLIRHVLRKKWLVIVIAVVLLGGSVSLFPLIGVSYFPIAEKPLLLVDIETPEGSDIYETDKGVRYVEDVLDTLQYVSSYTSNTGHSNPQIFYNRLPTRFKKNYGQVMVQFKEWEQKTFYKTLGQLENAFSGFENGRITFRELKNGEPFVAPIHIKILGPNLDTLTKLSKKVADVIEKTDGTKEIDNFLSRRKLNLDVGIDLEKTQFLGLNPATVDQYVRTAISGQVIDDIKLEDKEEYPLKIRIDHYQKPDIEDFSKIHIPNQLGAFVPLNQVSDLQLESTVPRINHYNTQRSVSVTANVYDPEMTAEISQNVVNKLENMDFPSGYSYFVTGELEKQQQTFANLQQLLIVAIIAIFAVLVLKFNSFAQPFIIFSALPFALAGSFIALFLTGWTFSFLAFVGFISLLGIVVNDSIILVNHANQLRAKDVDFYDALILSCKRRFVPVILTTLTTIAGLLPLTLTGSKFWSPLCWTIIGGLFTSSLLTLVIIPVLYDWFTSKESAKN